MSFSTRSQTSLALLAVATLSSASFGIIPPPIVVSPVNMNGWAFNSVAGSGAANTGDFVTGPATAPLGTGSAHFLTGAGSGDGSVQIRTSAFAGTLLSTVSALSYSTYATAHGGDELPYLTLYVSTTGGTTYNDRLIFEPVYSAAGAGNGNLNPQPAVADNTWQNWDALNGMWYSDNVGGPGAQAFTLGSYLTTFPNTTIVNDDVNGLGGVRVATGFASDTDNFDENLDNFQIGVGPTVTTYDFEPAAVPEPASLTLLALGTAGLLTRRRKA